MPGSVPPAPLILLAMVAATVPPLAAQNRKAVDASGREVVRPRQAASSIAVEVEVLARLARLTIH